MHCHRISAAAGHCPRRFYETYRRQYRELVSSQNGKGNNGCVLYIGTPGNIRVKTVGGDDVIFTGVYAGQFFPVQVLQVFDTGTTAGEIVALW